MFFVYKKDKKDFIHYVSVHNKTTKEGVDIGFFLQTLTICRPEFLEEEILHVSNTFHFLRCPRALFNFLRSKAKMTMIRPRGDATQDMTHRITISSLGIV